MKDKDTKTILLVALVAGGAIYMATKDKGQQQPPQNYYPQPAYPQQPGYAYQPAPQPTTGQKIVNTIETGQKIIEAGKGVIDVIGSLFGKKTSTGINFVPQYAPYNQPGTMMA